VIARARLAAGLLCFGSAAVALLTMTAVDRSFAAASAGCDGGGFTALTKTLLACWTIPAHSVFSFLCLVPVQVGHVAVRSLRWITQPR